MVTEKADNREEEDLSQEPYPSPRFFLEPGEQVQLEALNVGLKKFQFHAYLTDRRIFLIDVVEKKVKAIAKEIPLKTIAGSIVEISQNQDPVLVLSVHQDDDEIKTMKITFVQGGTDRSAEIDTWIETISGEGPAPRKAPGAPPAAPARAPAQARPEPEPIPEPEPEYLPEPEPGYLPEYEPEPEPAPQPQPKKRQVIVSKAPAGARPHGAWPPVSGQPEPTTAKASKTQPGVRPATQPGMQRPSAAPTVRTSPSQPSSGVPRPAARIPQHAPPVRQPEPSLPGRKPEVQTPMKTAMKNAMQPLRQPGLQPIRQPSVKPMREIPPPAPAYVPGYEEEQEEEEEEQGNADTIFCYNCGRKVLRIANFCPECGTPQTHPKEKKNRSSTHRQHPAKSPKAQKQSPEYETDEAVSEEEPPEDQVPQRKGVPPHKKPHKKQDSTILHKFLKR